MAGILLTHSYFYKFDRKQWDTKQPYPPLGTLYAASVLLKEDFSVSLFDTNLADSPLDIIPLILKNKPLYLVIYDDGFNYLSKMCLNKMREAAFRLIDIGKEHGCIIITAGSDSSDNYEKYLNAGADYVIIGEGELTLKELINTLENGGPELSAINGLAFRKQGKTIRTAGRSILKNLNELPFPAWHLVDIERYRKIWMDNHGYFSLNIATTRGCPFHCNWCAKPIYGNRYNSRSPENVVKEIE
ncbi:MAG: B12-binding domain-containing radical SAM protein, partial [Syntrophothermus sp.]